MRFDDRLKTVMTQPVADAHDRTVRWRQIVDLLSRPHEGIDPALFDGALTMIRSGLKSVPLKIRAATARSIAGRPADARLLAIFAADKLEVAAPLIASASLDDAGWALIGAAATTEVAAFVHSIRGVGDAPPAAEAAAAPPAAVPEQADEHSPSIGEMVARIERLKSKRGDPGESGEAMPPAPEWTTSPSPANPSLFRWECDASGQIGWVEGAPRGALIGRSLPGEDGADRRLIRAFADRMPFDGTPLSLPEPALPGEWTLSGIPAFSPVDGRFLGYRGIARRDLEIDQPLPAGGMSGVATDTDALRETIHEIKTPLNAIIGFAEIIDGQYLGPAHRNYRQRASEIVAQARILLAAIDDLDFAAKLQSSRLGQGEGTDFAEIFPRMTEELNQYAAARGAGLLYKLTGSFYRCALDPELSERLVRRFVTGVIDVAGEAETLSLEVGPAKGMCAISISRPNAIKGATDKQLFDPAFVIDPDDKLGIGFSLRLVRGLARMAGGNLKLTTEQLILLVPAKKDGR